MVFFSATKLQSREPARSHEGAFTHLGFPSYLQIELNPLRKALVSCPLEYLGIPAQRPKISLNFGFALTLISASIAHFFPVGRNKGLPFWFDPPAFLGTFDYRFLMVYFARPAPHEPQFRASRRTFLARQESGWSTPLRTPGANRAMSVIE